MVNEEAEVRLPQMQKSAIRKSSSQMNRWICFGNPYGAVKRWAF